MTVAFEISEVLPATPQAIYQAWLDSKGHTLMTGSPAQASARAGEQLQRLGWIYLRSQPGVGARQAYRTGMAHNGVPAIRPDSRLEVILEPEGKGARVTIRHSNLPLDGMQYKQGWVEFYFEPMLAYFQD